MQPEFPGWVMAGGADAGEARGCFFEIVGGVFLSSELLRLTWLCKTPEDNSRLLPAPSTSVFLQSSC